MTDLVTIRKYIAGLIRKERARRRKAETSVAELVTEIDNWRSRADKTDAEILSLEERLEQLQDERRDQAKGHQSDAWCWTAVRTELEKERDAFAKDRQNWKTLANEKGAELNKATERVRQLEEALQAYADGAGDVKEWCDIGGSGCSTKWFHGVIGSDYAKEVLGKVTRQDPKRDAVFQSALGSHCLPQTAAGRLAIIQELLDPNVYDEDGNVIGQKTPLITKEQARELLEFPSVQSTQDPNVCEHGVNTLTSGLCNQCGERTESQ